MSKALVHHCQKTDSRINVQRHLKSDCYSYRLPASLSLSLCASLKQEVSYIPQYNFRLLLLTISVSMLLSVNTNSRQFRRHLFCSSIFEAHQLLFRCNMRCVRGVSRHLRASPRSRRTHGAKHLSSKP